ncbi:MAG TPA: alpha-L-fucosidase [Candidatus Coprenecus merdigallinarum]|nr:alpha-L-fucosidase [Candidatus Coprenecus merdigallinarum]
MFLLLFSSFLKLLLNVGPQPDGNIPAAALERLAAKGEWLAVNGETIYGTRSILVKPQPWGVTTHKDDRMWLHVFPADAFKAASDGQIYVPYKAGRKVASVTPFGSPDVKLGFKQYKEGLFVTLPSDMPADVPDYIVEVTFK